MSNESLFLFGEGYGAYFGLVDQNELHRNAAYQIVIGRESAVTILGDGAPICVGEIILIKPLAQHKIKCDGPISLIYLSPKSNFVLCHLKHMDTADITPLEEAYLPFTPKSSSGEIIDALNRVVHNPKSNLDPRLVMALDDLGCDLQNVSIAQTAEKCGISRSRLRALARDQLGLPLSTWVIWKKLIESNKALSLGASLSEAALQGGFSDQAHFTRTMKRMFGVTPTSALKVFA